MPVIFVIFFSYKAVLPDKNHYNLETIFISSYLTIKTITKTHKKVEKQKFPQFSSTF